MFLAVVPEGEGAADLPGHARQFVPPDEAPPHRRRQAVDRRPLPPDGRDQQRRPQLLRQQPLRAPPPVVPRRAVVPAQLLPRVPRRHAVQRRLLPLSLLLVHAPLLPLLHCRLRLQPGAAAADEDRQGRALERHPDPQDEEQPVLEGGEPPERAGLQPEPVVLGEEVHAKGPVECL